MDPSEVLLIEHESGTFAFNKEFEGLSEYESEDRIKQFYEDNLFDIPSLTIDELKAKNLI